MLSMVSNLYLLSTLSGGMYSIQNQNNIYNLLISILNRASDQEKKAIITDIKILVGCSFYDNFKSYVQRKFSIDSELVILMAK